MSRHKRGPGEGSDPSLRKEPPKGEEDGAFFEEKLPALRAQRIGCCRLGFLVARDVLAGHVAGSVGEAAGVAAAVEGAVDAGHRFPRSVEAVDGLHVPAEDFEVLGDAHAAAGEVVPREHADHAVRTGTDLVLLVGTAELRVVLRFDGLVPEFDLALEAFEVHAGLLAELFKRVGLPEVLAEFEFLEDAFFGPGGQADKSRELDRLERAVPGGLVGEHVVAAVRVVGEVRRDVADAFLFRHEALAVLVDEDAALVGDEPPAAVRAVAAAGDDAAGIRGDVLHVGERNADVAHGGEHGGAVVVRAADYDALAGDGRNPAVKRLGRARDAARGHDDAEAGAAVDDLVVAAALDADNAVGLFIKPEARDGHGVMDLDFAFGELLHEAFDVVAPLEGILTMGAAMRVAGVVFKMMSGKTVLGKPVEGFAGVLGEGVDRFLEAHVVAVGHDVFCKGLPAVLDGRVGLLELGAVGGEEAAAEIGGSMERGEAGVEDFDLLACVDNLAGGHHAGAAAAENDDIGFHVPLGGHAGGGGGGGKGRSGGACSGGGGGGAEKMAAGKHLFSHDHSPFMRIAKLWQSLHSKWDLPCMLWQALQSFSPR